MMSLFGIMLGVLHGSTFGTVTPAQADTLRVEVGSRLVDGRIYQPHAARVRVHLDSVGGPLVNEWTNELTLGDSAGRPVMRWVTRGGKGGYVLRQTYDHVTLAPLGHWVEGGNGGYSRLGFDGNRVRGKRKMSPDSAEATLDFEMQTRGFVASASDLVPLAVKSALKPGAVMTAPLWGPQMTNAEMRIFTVVGKVPKNIEGKDWMPWKVEERRQSDRKLLAIWYLVEESPYMIGGEVFLPNGRVQHMTEVAIPMPR